jgi:hypothetical protein
MPPCSLQMIVKPPQQDLIGRQPQQIVDRLSLLAEPIKLGVQLDIHLGQQTLPDNLPDQAQNQMFPPLRDICRADIDDRTANTLRRGDDYIIVFGDLEGVEGFARSGFVEDTDVDSIRNGVVDEFTEDKTIFTFVEELHCVRWDREAVADVGIVLEDLL